MGGNVCLRCKGNILLGIVNKLLKTMQCLLFPKVNFPANNLNFHWMCRWWDQIQAIFLNLFYFKWEENMRISIFLGPLWMVIWCRPRVHRQRASIHIWFHLLTLHIHINIIKYAYCQKIISFLPTHLMGFALLLSSCIIVSHLGGLGVRKENSKGKQKIYYY